jgi:hypothetical protein
MRSQQVIRQRADLLDTRNGNVVDPSLLALLEKLVVHLTRAEDVSADLLGRDEVLGVRVGDVALEDGVALHLLEVGSCERVSEQRLGEEDDELERERVSERCRVFKARPVNVNVPVF